jgi:hypothetical protein
MLIPKLVLSSEIGVGMQLGVQRCHGDMYMGQNTRALRTLLSWPVNLSTLAVSEAQLLRDLPYGDNNDRGYRILCCPRSVIHLMTPRKDFRRVVIMTVLSWDHLNVNLQLQYMHS